MILLLWVVLFGPAFLLGFLCRIISPFLCLFVVRESKLDTVKRYGKKKVTLPRDNLIPLFWGFNTHDNNTDEWWYGMYNTESFWFCRNWTQEDYDDFFIISITYRDKVKSFTLSTPKAMFIRWFCRVMWLQRNSAYGFNYAWFSKPVEPYSNVYEYGQERGKWWLLLQTRPSSFQLEVRTPLVVGMALNFAILYPVAFALSYFSHWVMTAYWLIAAIGFAYTLFNLNKINSVNIGWKEHTDKPRLLYAGRVLGIRKHI